jgi:uncharacterized protein (TIGR02646 family)
MASHRRKAGLAHVIPVQRQPEPPNFEAAVRARGRKITLPAAPVPSVFWKNKEHWRNALDDLYRAYNGVCAYSGMHIHPVTGNRTVEHFLPKRDFPEQAYEWNNYRLICGLMNGRKNRFTDVLDPFDIPPDTFTLNPQSGAISVHPNCPPSLQLAAFSTIDRLRLNDGELQDIRHGDHFRYANGDWTEAELLRQNPFVHHCLAQQNLL